MHCVLALTAGLMTALGAEPVFFDARVDSGYRFFPPLTGDGVLFINEPCNPDTEAKLRALGIQPAFMPLTKAEATSPLGPDGEGGYVFQKFLDYSRCEHWTWKPGGDPARAEALGGRYYSLALEDGSLAGSGLESDWFYRSSGEQVRVWSLKKNPDGYWVVIGGQSPELYVAGETAKGVPARFGLVRKGVFEPYKAPNGWTGVIPHHTSRGKAAVSLYRASDPWKVIMGSPIDSMIPFQAAVANAKGEISILPPPRTLRDGNKVISSQALAINAAGDVVGRVAINRDGDWRGAIWRNGQCHLVDELYPNLPPIATAVAITDSGAVLAYTKAFPGRAVIIPPVR